MTEDQQSVISHDFCSQFSNSIGLLEDLNFSFDFLDKDPFAQVEQTFQDKKNDSFVLSQNCKLKIFQLFYDRKIIQAEQQLENDNEEKIVNIMHYICQKTNLKRTNEQKFKFIFLKIVEKMQKDFRDQINQLLKTKTEYLKKKGIRKKRCKIKFVFCSWNFFKDKELNVKDAIFQLLFFNFYFKYPEKYMGILKYSKKCFPKAQKVQFNQSTIRKMFKNSQFKEDFRNYLKPEQFWPIIYQYTNKRLGKFIIHIQRKLKQTKIQNHCLIKNLNYMKLPWKEKDIEDSRILFQKTFLEQLSIFCQSLKIIIQMKIILIYLISTSLIVADQNDRQHDITFQESALDELRENEYEDTQCNKELLLDFNLKGYEQVQQETHQFCPYINLNCCTDKDQNFSMFMWNTQYKKTFEEKIQVYIKAVKYLFGFVDQINSYAKYIHTSQNQQCQIASEKVLSMNLTEDLVKQVVSDIYYAKQQVSNIRKGFQCVLCDGKTYMSLDEQHLENKKFKKIQVSMSFCQDLVEETIEASYKRLNYFISFLENFSILHQCKAYLAIDESLKFAENQERREVTNQCMAFKEKDFAKYCMKYCNEFSFNKENPLIDGAFGSLIPFLDLFMKQRSYFTHQTNHVFFSNLGQIEREIKNDIKMYQDDFYIKSTSDYRVIQVQTEYTKGIDNYNQIKENAFFYGLSSSKIILIGTILSFVFNQINDNNLK